MALKKAEDNKDEKATQEKAATTAAEKVESATGDAGTQTQAATAPAVIVEPTEPAAPPVVQKTEKELQAEKDAADQQAADRLADENAVREQAGKPVKKELTLVPVENVRHTAFMQPSTGKWIKGGATENLLDDGWLENHVKAGLLKKV